MGIQAADLTTAAATQISRPESLDAKHNVTIGSNPPVRLDKISARHIPFLGFKTATRIEKEQAGIVTQLSHVADALLAPNIDAKALLTSLATVQGYCDKLVASSKSANPSKPVDVDATIMVLGSEAFAKLPNEKMQALFDKLVSKDFDALRRAIAFEARTNPALRTKMLFALSALSALEAAVVSDISSRVVSSHNTPAQAADGPQPGAHESTVALETGVSLSLKGEKESAMADAERAPQRKIMGGATVSAQQIADKCQIVLGCCTVPVVINDRHAVRVSLLNTNGPANGRLKHLCSDLFRDPFQFFLDLGAEICRYRIRHKNYACDSQLRIQLASLDRVNRLYDTGQSLD